MKTSTPLLYPRLRKVLVLLPLVLLLFSLLYPQMTPYGRSYVLPIKGIDIAELGQMPTRRNDNLVPPVFSQAQFEASKAVREWWKICNAENQVEITSPEARRPNSVLLSNMLNLILSESPPPGNYPETWAQMLARYPQSVEALKEMSRNRDMVEPVHLVSANVPLALLKMESLRLMSLGKTAEAADLLAFMLRNISPRSRLSRHQLTVFTLLSSWGRFSAEDLQRLRQSMKTEVSVDNYVKLSAIEYARSLGEIVEEPVNGENFASNGNKIYQYYGRRSLNRYDEAPLWDLRWFIAGIAGHRAFGLSLRQEVTLNAVSVIAQSDKEGAWAKEQNSFVMGRWNQNRFDLLAHHFAKGYYYYGSLSRDPIQTMANEQIQTRLLHLLVDIEEYRVANGAPPSHLDQLPLPSNPSDRIDPFTGKSLIYKATPTQYQVYSLGWDTLDHGGYDDRRPGGGSRDIAARVLL